MLEQGFFYTPPIKTTGHGQWGGSRTLASIPKTNWVAPHDFPNLSAASRIAIDTETYDPELLTNGPGWARNKGHICGISIAVDEGDAWYFPIKHDLGKNLDPDQVKRFLQDSLSDSSQPKVGANLTYDVGWLDNFGVQVKGLLLDVQFAEALLDDFSPSVSLESLAQKYVGEGKADEQLYAWAAESYGGEANRRAQGGNIHRCPVELVGPYAEQDARLPLQILDKQWELLCSQNLNDLFLLECKLIPILIGMRKRGVRINIDKCEEVKAILTEKQLEQEAEIKRISGRRIQLFSAADIAIAFDAIREPYLMTKTGKPSFTQIWLEAHKHPLAKAIVSARRYDKAKGTFIENYLLDKQINGRIHGQFHPLRNDEGGAVSGRFSSSSPNLQNIPSRDKELGPLIRSLFIPDDDSFQWEKLDYSQIEYRFLAHFAVGKGADKIRSEYKNEPNTDYHEATGKLIASQTGSKLSRYDTKRINFGLAYGMGQRKLALTLELSEAEATKLFAAYHRGVPFVKKTFDFFTRQAENRGYVQTILNRRSRFPTKKGAHKGLNRVLQGSAADLMKAAMVKCYEAGIFDVLGYPLLTVHDELDFDNPKTKESEEAISEVIRIMQDAIPINVPVIADRESGPNWGSVK